MYAQRSGMMWYDIAWFSHHYNCMIDIVFMGSIYQSRECQILNSNYCKRYMGVIVATVERVHEACQENAWGGHVRTKWAGIEHSRTSS